jgi:RNA polymerase sigma-70 factor (ECF subfamily)
MASGVLLIHANDHPFAAGCALHACHKGAFMGTIAADTMHAQPSPDGLCADAIEEMTTLISERLPYFYRIALRRLNNAADAEDAVQDALLSAWKHLDKFKGDAQMSTWLTTIVMNSALMVLRKRPRALHLPIEDPHHDSARTSLSDLLPDASPDPETQVRQRELSSRLEHLSAHLNPQQREMIELRSFKGLSIRETGDVLGLSDSVVKTRSARARQALKRLHECSPRYLPPPTGSARSRRRLSSNAAQATVA